MSRLLSSASQSVDRRLSRLARSALRAQDQGDGARVEAAGQPWEAAVLIAHILKDKGDSVLSVPAEASLEDAAKLLNAHKVGAVVVLNGAGRLAGVLSERDIVREIAKRGPTALADTVSSAMTRNVITARPDESIDDGLERMTDRRIRHLPIVDGERLVGIISIGDLVKRKIEAVQFEAVALRSYIAAG